jgi:hypothetical protein
VFDSIVRYNGILESGNENASRKLSIISSQGDRPGTWKMPNQLRTFTKQMMSFHIQSKFDYIGNKS